MRILVTGGAGFIGSGVVAGLVEAGHEVVNVDSLTATASLASIWHLEEALNYRFEPVDLSDRDGVFRIVTSHRPQLIVHLASERRSSADKDTMVEANVRGTSNLLAAAEALEDQNLLRFVHGMQSIVLGPLSAGTATHVAADDMALAARAVDGLPVTRLAMPAVFGPRQFPDQPLPLTLLKLIEGEEVTLPTDAHRSQSWAYVHDVVGGIIQAALAQGTASDLRLSGSDEISLVDVTRHMARALQVRRPSALGVPYTSLIKTGAGDAEAHHPDRLRGFAKIQAGQLTPLSEALGQTVEWYLQNEVWWKPLMKQRSCSRSSLGAVQGQVA